jgi:hypothetical protein
MTVFDAINNKPVVRYTAGLHNYQDDHKPCLYIVLIPPTITR